MITLDSVTKKFGTGESALSDITLTIDSGEFVFLVGPSGSGKTTLFRLLTREILPTQGVIHINEWNITKLPRGKVSHLRRRIGVVFQDLKLLSDRTILENIMLPLQIAGADSKKANMRALAIMSEVGIESHKNKFPVQLSGGELQRVGIARAIVFTPEIVIADEPTGNLDAVTSWEIVKILQDINKNGTTVLMATHNTDVVKSLAKRVVLLEQGKVLRDAKPRLQTPERSDGGQAVITEAQKKHEMPNSSVSDNLSESEVPKKTSHHKKQRKIDE